MFSKLKKSVEFVVHVPGQSFDPEQTKLTVPFSIKPANLQNVKKSLLKVVPDFNITGKLDSTICDISQPLTGKMNDVNVF